MHLPDDVTSPPLPRRIERPLFIVGAPRSDVSSLFEMLARSPSLHTVGTGADTREIAARIPQLQPAARHFESDRLTSDDADAQVAARFARALYRELRDRDGHQAEGPVRLLERTPKNALCVPFLHAIFPDAVFIYLYRDPASTMLSMLDAWRSGAFVTHPALPGWDGPPWSLPLVPGWRELSGHPLPQVVASQWRIVTETLLGDLEKLPPAQWCVTSNERLTRNPARELRRLCNFAALEWDDQIAVPLPRPEPHPDDEQARGDRAAIEGLAPAFDAVAGRAREIFARPPGRRTRAAAIDDPARFRSVGTASFAQILGQLRASLIVTTYQSGRVILVRNDDGKLNTHLRHFVSPMGVAVDRDRLALGTKREVWEFRNQPDAGRRLPEGERNDACFLPRRMHVTGDIRIHEVGYVAGELWAVNTRFSTLCTFDGAHSFVPRWRPPFVTHLSADDRCHLNGMAIHEDRVRWVTALGETNVARGWRERKATGGIIIDVDGGEVVMRGLSMPHSPRWHDGRLWFLESGRGSLAVADLATGHVETIVELPGFTRGLAFAAPFAFVGLSQIRETNVFGGLPLTDRLAERLCGVWIVDLRSGTVAGFLRFEDFVQEIFDVQILPGMRFPELLEPSAEILSGAFALPAAALADVAR